MAILSKGQRLALDLGQSLDGFPCSPQYTRLVKRNVNVKVFESCAGLHELYEKYPEFRSLIENGLRWLTAESAPVPKSKPSGDGEKRPVKQFPESLESLEPYVPEMTKDQAFREFQRANPSVNS